MFIGNYSHSYTADQLKNMSAEKSGGEYVKKTELFSNLLSAKKQSCPYDYLAKDGVISYGGLTFVCDYETNSICLGDMSDKNKVLNISLPSGGNLKLNIECFGEISKAASMFSPADLNAILRAIARYNHCVAKQKEIEDDEEKSLGLEKANDVGTAMESFRLLKEKFIEEHQLTAEDIKVETDWREMTEDQWKKLLENVDKYLDDFKERLKEMEELQKKAAQKGAALAPADKKAIAAARAALKALANGTLGSEKISEGESEESLREKESWTYEMTTDDQVILATAKRANEVLAESLTKAQEIALFGDTLPDEVEDERLP